MSFKLPDDESLATETEVKPITWDELKAEELADEWPVVVVPRESWGAKPPTKVTPLVTPVTRVGITFNSYSEECKTKADCIRVLQGIQKVHMDEFGMSDIAYNWMVGGDGRIYEGRGWKGVPNLCLENPNAHFTKMVDITYIGEFDSPDNQPGRMYNSVQKFLEKSVKEGKITKDFEMK